MKNSYQTIEWTTQMIIKKFRKNPNSSVSALFRNLRDSQSLSLFADAPIISHIINTLASVGIYPERRKVAFALRQSVELKGKKSFLSSILEGNIRQLQREIDPETKKIRKTMDSLSISIPNKRRVINANS